jgi:energy-coupling factor transporter transmembrane protein EcfT
MTARARLVVALVAVAVAVSTPPLGGGVVAACGVLAILLERATARAWRSLRAPLLTVAIALALQAWLAGRHAALVLGARVAGATAASAWLLATTRPGELIEALRRLGMPAALVDMLALAARYISVLGETLTTAREAQRVRLGWQGLGARVRSFGALGGVVVGRAVDQSVAIGEAMRVRGGGQP